MATRLEEFAERVTELLYEEAGVFMTVSEDKAARAIIGREVRELFEKCADEHALSCYCNDFLDSRSPTPEQREAPDWGPALDRELGQPTATKRSDGCVHPMDRDGGDPGWRPSGLVAPEATKPCPTCLTSGWASDNCAPGYSQRCPTCKGEGRVPA